MLLYEGTLTHAYACTHTCTHAPIRSPLTWTQEHACLARKQYQAWCKEVGFPVTTTHSSFTQRSRRNDLACEREHGRRSHKRNAAEDLPRAVPENEVLPDEVPKVDAKKPYQSHTKHNVECGFHAVISATTNDHIKLSYINNGDEHCGHAPRLGRSTLSLEEVQACVDLHRSHDLKFSSLLTLLRERGILLTKKEVWVRRFLFFGFCFSYRWVITRTVFPR